MNDVTKRDATNTTDWKIYASDGTPYDTLGALVAASKVPFPGLDGGNHLRRLILRSDNGSGADGSEFWYHVGGDAAPSAGVLSNDAEAKIDGVAADGSSLTQIRNVWVKKVTGTNGITLYGEY